MQHLIGDTANSRNDIVFTSSAWNCLRLSLIDDEIFPIPHFSTPNLPDTSSLPSNASLIEPYHTKKLYPSGPLIFRPREKNIVFPTTAGGVHAAKRDLLKRNPEFAAECSKAKQAVRADPRWGQPSTMVGDDIVVTTIGTGSAIPSKYRNVSCTHLDIPNVGGVLLDTGEGTLGQLRRRFGQEGMQKVYEDLRMIFISHMHADHHLGLQAVLEDRFKVSVRKRQVGTSGLMRCSMVSPLDCILSVHHQSLIVYLSLDLGFLAYLKTLLTMSFSLTTITCNLHSFLDSVWIGHRPVQK